MSADPQAKDELDGTEQPFVSHLIELRDRLLWSLYGVIAVLLALLAWPGPRELYELLARPLIESLPQG